MRDRRAFGFVQVVGKIIKVVIVVSQPQSIANR
jgi:hypothetical protein